MMYGDFMYSARESHHVSSCIAFPPFGRWLYSFEEGTRGILD
jgi:hypothetical protein